MLNESERAKLERILGLLEEQRICLERAQHMMRELEKQLRFRLNDDFSIKT